MTQLFFHSLTLHPLCLWNCNSFFAFSAVYFTLLLYCTLVHSWSYVPLLLANSHCGVFIPHVPFSISISLSCAVSLLSISVYQSITLFLYLIPFSIYCFYSFLTSLSPETALIMYCVLSDIRQKLNVYIKSELLLLRIIWHNIVLWRCHVACIILHWLINSLSYSPCISL